MDWSVLLPPLSPEPALDEPISRYLRQSGHFSASNARVKPRAYHPAPADHKVSVFRVQGLTEVEIWLLGDASVTGGLEARADLSVAQVCETGLHLESAEPPIRHADIVGWPVEKDAWMSKAQELAAKAVLRLRHA